MSHPVHDGADALAGIERADDGYQDAERGMVLAERPRAAVVPTDAEGNVAPGQLILAALDRGVPADALEKLVALQERMETRNAAQAFNRAMAAFQNDCPPIKKNKTAKIATRGGGSFSYSYAERDEIEAHIKPYREKYDLSHTFDTIVDDKGVMLTNICTVSHILGHSRSSRFTLPIANDSAASPQQKVGAADSYAARRTLAAAYGLSITDKEVPDEEVDPTTVSEDQALELRELLAESGADQARFLAFMDAASVEEVRAADYPKAKNALLERKRAAERKRERAQ